MKTKSILICFLFAITANSFIAARAQVNTTDSLALVDLYNSTNGPNWSNHTNWLTKKSVRTWYGITVTGSYVTSVLLPSNRLTGTIPATLGNLINLTNLDLHFNQLSGIIPSSIGNLVNLTALNFFGNSLTGTIPPSIGNLIKLTIFELSYNQLSGAIPAEVGNLNNLNLLYLDLNQLSGTIPLSIGNLVKLTNVELDNNQLSGAIPANLGNLKNLHGLYLENNQLSGTIPLSLNKLQSTSVDLSYNRLTKFADGYPSKDTDNIRTNIGHNYFTFYGLQVIAKYYPNVNYEPQDTVLPIHQSGNILSVNAGGTVSNNKYKWLKVGSVNSTTIKGDATFHPSSNGRYYAQVTNSVATKLTLYSDTISYTMPLAATQNSVANVAAAKAFTNHFSIYPNPAKDIIHVQVNGNATIVLTNSAGKIIFSKSINNDSEINVSAYANGVYYLQNKNTGETQKIVVVH